MIVLSAQAALAHLREQKDTGKKYHKDISNINYNIYVYIYIYTHLVLSTICIFVCINIF